MCASSDWPVQRAVHRRHQRTRICAQCRAGAAFSGRPSSRSDARSEQKMQKYSATLQFEQAARVRDQIRALANGLQPQAMEMTSEQDADILAVAAQDGIACINVAMVRGRRHLGDQTIFT